MTQKPDDIPQGIWDAAMNVVQCGMPGGKTIGESVARAIVAEREACAQVAESWLIDWAGDLQDTRDSYIEARKSGRHNGRKIPEDMAATFAGQFRERSEAVFGCADNVAAAIRNRN